MVQKSEPGQWDLVTVKSGMGMNPTVKLLEVVEVPPGVVTLMVPVVALVGMVAVICVLAST